MGTWRTTLEANLKSIAHITMYTSPPCISPCLLCAFPMSDVSCLYVPCVFIVSRISMLQFLLLSLCSMFALFFPVLHFLFCIDSFISCVQYFEICFSFVSLCQISPSCVFLLFPIPSSLPGVCKPRVFLCPLSRRTPSFLYVSSVS